MKTGKTPQALKLAIAVLLLGVAGALLYRNWEEMFPPSLGLDEAATRRMTASQQEPPPDPGPQYQLRRSAPELPSAPTVALLDFTTDDHTYLHQRGAAELTSAIQAGLGEVPPFRWIERQQLAPATGELSVAAVSGVDASSDLRLGQWLKADLLLRGRILDVGKPSQRLVLELIELARADVAASREVRLPGAIGGVGEMPVESVTAAQDAVRAVLEEGWRGIRERAAAIRVAPLFFRNIGRTDRLVFLERRIITDLEQRARQTKELHILRFPAVDPAAAEAELAMVGLTDGAADAWHYLADLYLWGTVEEAATTKEGEVAFDDLEVKLSIQAWNGFDQIQALEETVKVRDLPAAQERLADRIAQLAQRPRSTQVSLRSRNELVASLAKLARSSLAKARPQRGAGQGEPATPWSRAVRAHALNQLEVAAFLAPDSRDTRQDLLQYRWPGPYPSGPDAAAAAWAHLEAWDRYLKLFPLVTPEGKGYSTTAVRGYLNALTDVLYVFESPASRGIPADTPNALRRQWRDDILRRSTAFAAQCRPFVDNGQLKPEAFANDVSRLIHYALTLPGDARVTAEHVDAWWPFVKESYIRSTQVRGDRGYVWRGIEERLQTVYAQVGREADLAKMLDPDVAVLGRPGVAGTGARGPSAGGPAAAIALRDARVKHELDEARQRVARRRAAGKVFFASPPDVVPDTPSPVAQKLVVTKTVRRIWPPMRPLDPQHAEQGSYAVTYPEQRYRTHDLVFAAGRLWISADYRAGGSPPGREILLAYEPASDCWIDVSKRIGAHSVIRDLAPAGDAVWLGTESDGALRLDSSTLKLTAFTGENGLADRSVRSIAQVERDIVVATDAKRLSVLPAGADRFIDIVPSNAGADAGTPDLPLPLLAHRGQLLTLGHRPILINPRTGEVRSVQDILQDRAPDVQSGPNGRWIVHGVSADDHGIALATEGQLIHYSPGSDRVRHWDFPIKDSEGPGVVACDGDFVWVAFASERNELSPGDARLIRKPMSLVFIGHAPTQRWIGYVAMDGTVVSLCPSGTRMWLALNDSAHPFWELDKTPVYCGAQAGWAGAADPVPSIPDAAQVTGVTPLMTAAYAGDVATVAELLDGGADVNAMAASRSTALISAAAAGHSHIVKALLDRGANPAAQVRQNDRSGTTALHAAASFDRQDIQRLLAEKGAPVSATSALLGSPLTAATVAGHVQRVTSLIDLGADPNSENIEMRHVSPAESCSPLLLAVQSGNEELVRLLCERGALANQTSGWYQTTALHHAVLRGDVDIVRSLLAAKADPNLGTYHYHSALMIAIARRDMEMAKVLLEHGADINKFGSRGTSPLGIACAQGTADLSSWLLAAGANINASGSRRYVQGGSPQTAFIVVNTAFTLAARHRQRHVLQMLLDAGVDLRASIDGVRQGDLAFIRAAQAGDFDIMLALLELGFDINARDHMGRTALHAAVDDRVSMSVQFLLESGADATIIDQNGRTPSDLADAGYRALLSRGNAAAAPTRQNWTSKRQLTEAVEGGDAAVCRILLQEGADANAKTDDGWPLIVLAARSGNAEIMGMLISGGAQVDAAGPGGWTAVMQAARHGHAATLQLLVKAKAELQFQTTTRKTALDLAREHGQTETVALLEQAGAARQDGRAMIDAVRRSNFVAVRRLLRGGASVNGVDHEGRTPLFYALDGRNPPQFRGSRFERKIGMVELLLENGAEVNHRAKDGTTPLLALLKCDELESIDNLVALLLFYGAETNARTAENGDAMELAQRIRVSEVRKRVVEKLEQSQ